MKQAEINQHERGTEQRHQHIPAHEDHEQIAAPDGNPVVDLHGVVGKHIAHQAAAVERRNREQVEKAQRKVDENSQGTKQHQRLRCKCSAWAQASNERRHNNGAPVGNGNGHDHQGKKGNQDDQQVGNRAGQRGQIVVADNLAEVASDDRRRFSPTHQHSAKKAEPDERAKDHERGKEQGADRIHVIHGVEGDTTLQTSRLVAKPRSHPGMCALMHAERENEDHELELRFDKVGLLQTGLS